MIPSIISLAPIKSSLGNLQRGSREPSESTKRTEGCTNALTQATWETGGPIFIFCCVGCCSPWTRKLWTVGCWHGELLIALGLQHGGSSLLFWIWQESTLITVDCLYGTLQHVHVTAWTSLMMIRVYLMIRASSHFVMACLLVSLSGLISSFIKIHHALRVGPHQNF
jgi:hypothetical protein